MHARRHIAHVHRPTGAVEFGRAPGVILELLEVWQQLTPGPAGIAGRAPVVEVRGLPAYVHHGVDGARAAQHLAARPEGAAVLERRSRLGLVHPVETWVVEGAAVADRHLDPRRAACSAGLEQPNPMVTAPR